MINDNYLKSIAFQLNLILNNFDTAVLTPDYI